MYGEGMPVLCIHGYTVDHHIMTGCLEPVFQQLYGYQRIYIDLPGMGMTPSKPWIKNAADMLEFLMEWINKIIPEEQFLVIGESYGGYLTLGLLNAMQERIDGVMLICPGFSSERMNLPARCILQEDDAFRVGADETDVQDFLNMAVIATPETFDKFKRDIIPGLRLSDTVFLENYSRGLFSVDYVENLREYSKPACIITGRQDHVVGYTDVYEILESFPHATFAVLDCGGHNVQIENEPLFSQLALDWLWRIRL